MPPNVGQGTENAPIDYIIEVSDRLGPKGAIVVSDRLGPKGAIVA